MTKKMATKEKIFIYTLGCDKNTADSETILGMMKARGYEIVFNPREADIIMVNTCSFIHDAKDQSINAIIDLAQIKKKDQRLIVLGCLSQLYKEEIIEEIPEVDGILGATNYDRLPSLLEKIENEGKAKLYNHVDYTPKEEGLRCIIDDYRYAYLKIAEGCSQRCSYCIIPSLKGKFRSRPMEAILSEASYLVKKGKKEIIIVAQDVGKYGRDLYGRPMLTSLLRELSNLEGLEWIRLLYVYPEDITDDLIRAFKENPKLIHYIDMPLQHVSDKILKKMYRKSRKQTIYEIINKLRVNIEDICIRTTFIVGFPGENDKDFGELYDFMKEVKLDRVGVFAYSQESNTPAGMMKNQIPLKVRKRRRDSLMLLQQEISLEKNKALVNKEFEVLVEASIEDKSTEIFIDLDLSMGEKIYIGRSYRDTPDVDGLVYIRSDRMLKIGEIYRVKIKEAKEYDLIGEII